MDPGHLRLPDGSDLESPQNSSVRAVASMEPSNDLYSSITNSPSKMSAGSPIGSRSRHPKHFPTSRHLAQADPDYKRSTVPNSSATGEHSTQELFMPTLLKKPRQASTRASLNASRQPNNSSLPNPKRRQKVSENPNLDVKNNELVVRKEETRRARSYNEGYRDRIKSIQSSVRIVYDTNSIIGFLEEIYSKIMTFEVSLSAKLEKLNASTSASPFDEHVWEGVASQQLQLIELYTDFIYHASLPSDMVATTKRLVRKYNIPVRLWKNGVSTFAEILKSRSPASDAVLVRFSMHCMTLLMQLIAPGYDSRHVWMESLGDLALTCYYLDMRGCADWNTMVMYWYERRWLLTPGTGRIYRQMAVVCDSRLDTLFYLCKCLTSTQPSAVTSDHMKATIYRPHLVHMRANESMKTFVKQHLYFLGSGSPVGTQLKLSIMTLENEIRQCHYPITDHGATVAFCNISALMNYGDDSCSLNMFFKQLAGLKQGAHSGGETKDYPSCVPEQSEVLILEPIKSLAYHVLDAFLNVSDYTAGLQHVLVWIYFLIVVSRAPSNLSTAYIDSKFPFESLVNYLNGLLLVKQSEAHYSNDPSRTNSHIMHSTDPEAHLTRDQSDYLVEGKTQEHPSIEPIPSDIERSLPEEVHMRGFLWAQSFQHPYFTAEVDLLDEPFVAYYGSSHLTPVRVDRVLNLALELDTLVPWLEYDTATRFFCYNPQNQS